MMGAELEDLGEGLVVVDVGFNRTGDDGVEEVKAKKESRESTLFNEDSVVDGGVVSLPGDS